MERIIAAGKSLWNTPEAGYFEWETQKILSGLFAELGFSVDNFNGFPGFSARLTASRDESRRPKAVLVADMDALPNPGDPEGRYIHSCGHHMQMTVLYGAALILKEEAPDVLEDLVFAAVPAEEFIDFDKRSVLIQEGKVANYSGKQELLSRGFFGPFSFVIATHAAALDNFSCFNSVRRMNGFDHMSFLFTGRSSHAGASPYKGRNAQNAASLFLQAAAFLRETFNEEHHIRIHPVLRLEPNQSVNLIPEKVRVETYVRAAEKEALEDTKEKLLSGAKGAAQALGCGVSYETTKGYQPFVVNRELHALAERTAKKMGFSFSEEAFSAASSDMGDISQVKPSIILGLPGSNGLFHNNGFAVIDEEAAYVRSSRYTAEYLKTLIRN